MGSTIFFNNGIKFRFTPIFNLSQIHHGFLTRWDIFKRLGQGINPSADKLCSVGRKYQNRNFESYKVLLMMHILVCGHQHVKLAICRSEQDSILHGSPSRALNGLNRPVRPRIGQPLQQLSWQTLVNQYPNHADACSRSNDASASFRVRSAASRLRVGYESKISSKVMPSARFSNRTATGTRVPLNTGVPPKMSGSVETINVVIATS